MMKISLYLFLSLQTLSASALLQNSPIQSIRASQYSSSRTCLYDTPEPLAEEGTWQAFLDEETTGLVYYFDAETGESLWEPPTSTFPQVRLSRKKQREMEELRRTYRKARQQEEGVTEAEVEQPQAELPNWIEGLLSAPASAPAPAPAPAKKDWFGNIFGDSSSEEKEEEDEPKLEAGEMLVKRADTKPEKTKPGILEALSGVMQAETPVETKPAQKKLEKKVEKKPEKKMEEKVQEKIEDFSPKPIEIEMGSHVLPHPAKVRWGGEDAVFTKGRTFGVFDGVSGAEKLDGIPLYSRVLAEEMKKMVGAEGVSVTQLTKMLTDAANYADNAATGASTAVVASVAENGFLQALNIGDSFCYVIRNGRVAAKTREISHYWECPYQLSDDSPDRPKDGTKLNVELIAGDLIVMGSDGIFDNLDDDMILDLIQSSPGVKPSLLARKICDLSRKQSLDRNSVTPYGKQAQKRGDQDFKTGFGGKLDDVSCIVVRCK